MSWNFELLAGPFGGISEGPVWDGKYLFFTLILQNKIMRYDPATRECTEWRTETKRTNGLAIDKGGRIYGCCVGGRAIVRFDQDATTVVADNVSSRRLNTPNDIVISKDGSVWFTNPWNAALTVEGEQPETESQVFRISPEPGGDWTIRQMTSDMTQPNGLLFSADESILYVAESGHAMDHVRQLRAYPVSADGLGEPTVLHEFGKDYRGTHRGVDGMCLDENGNIIATAGWRQSGPGPLVYVFSPNGRVLETHEVPADRPTNCAFGGPDMRTLFLTNVDGCFFSAEVDRKGLPLFPIR